MIALTPEQRQAVERAGDEPIRIEDPETRKAYVLVKEDVYKRLREAVEIEEIDPSFFEIDDYVTE